MKKVQPVPKNPYGFELVINNGSDQLDSATLPIRWYATDINLLRRTPKYILIIEQTKQEYKSPNSGQNGIRRIVPFEDGINYLQVTKPGEHVITFIVFPELDGESKQEIHKRDGVSFYKNHIEPDFLKAKYTANENGFLFNLFFTAIAQVEVNIPQELFAEKPKTWFREAMWTWVNRWYETSPRDECVYRKRMIFAFTIQVALIFIGRFFMFLVALLGTIFYPIIRCILYFFGWEVAPLFQGTISFWRDIFWLGDFDEADIYLLKHGASDWNDFWKSRRIIDYEHYSFDYPTKERKITLFGVVLVVLFSWLAVLDWHSSIWFFLLSVLILSCTIGKIIARFKYDDLHEGQDKKSIKNRETNIEGFTFTTVVVSFAAAFILYNVQSVTVYVTSHTHQVINWSLYASAFGLVTFFIVLLIRNRRRILEAKEVLVPEIKRATKEDLLLQRYEKNFLVSAPPLTVGSSIVPKSGSVVKDTARILRVQFWVLKAKVCRPYSR